jgi:uncharacterized protein
LAKDLYFCKPKFEKMSGLFSIPIGGLKEGRHSYNFEVDTKFFDLFKESEIKEGKLTAVVELDKRPSHLDIRFRVSGIVRVVCDRCLEEYYQPIETESRLLVKIGSRWSEDDPDLLTVPADEHEFDIKQYLYEFIHLALPIQRFHPDSEDGISTCNPEMLKRISQHSVNDENNNDPRWDELKKLLKK